MALRDARSVDQRVLVAGSVLGISHSGLEVVHIVDGRPWGSPLGCRVAAEDVYGHTVVMVASPATRGFEGPTSGYHGPSGHELVIDLAVHASQPRDGCVKVAALGTPKGPLVQAVTPVAESVVHAFVGPAMNPSRDIDMYSSVEDIVFTPCGLDGRGLFRAGGTPTRSRWGST